MRRIVWLVCASVVGSGVLAWYVPHSSAQEPGARDEAAAPSGGESDSEDIEESDAETGEVEEGGNKVKVFRFSGLDISGRLKSPQLLYFLNRLRAEFDRPKLPHRSFIPELVRSTEDEEMRKE